MSVRIELLRLAGELCVEADLFRKENPYLAARAWQEAKDILGGFIEHPLPETIPRSRSLVLYQTEPRRDPEEDEFANILRKMRAVPLPNNRPKLPEPWSVWFAMRKSVEAVLKHF